MPAVESRLPVSVVVPTHRGAHRLPILLDALCEQDFEGEWELVMALDGVLDETPEVLERYRDRLPLRVVATDQPRGVVATLNDAFDQARGRILIRCDDDLTPAPHFLSRHLWWHEGRDDRGVVGATRDVFPDTPYARVYGQVANERTLAAAYARPADLRWISWAANNSIHRDAWAKVGGFDPRFVYGQDSELGYRLFESGVEIVIDPELEIEHRGPTTTAKARIPRAFVSGASRRLFDRQHPAAHPAPAPATSVVGRMWSALVGLLVAVARTKRAYERIGSAVEVMLPRLPDPIAGRVVALCVEAAGRAGQRHGSDDLASYKSQKVAELAAELGQDTRGSRS